MYTIAHLSDTHLDGGAGTRRRFKRVMAYLQASPAPLDQIILTGNLIKGGAVQGYRTIVEAVAGGIPALFCPGNCDPRHSFQAILLGE